jgi:hypothetical protein
VLGVGSRKSEEGWSGLSTVAQQRQARQCSERHRSGEAVEEEERVCSTVGCSLYNHQRQWNEGGTTVKPWVANSSGGRGWDVISMVWAPTSRQ